MIWIALAIVLAAIFVVGNLRVWRSETIRLQCVDLAITSRTLGGRAYVHAEKNEVVIERATTFEHYVRGIKPKGHDPRDPPPPPPPPHRIDRLTEGNV